MSFLPLFGRSVPSPAETYKVNVDGKTYKVKYAGDVPPDEKFVREALAGQHPDVDVKEEKDWHLTDILPDSLQPQNIGKRVNDFFSKDSPSTLPGYTGRLNEGGQPEYLDEDAARAKNQTSGALSGFLGQAAEETGKTARDFTTPTNLALMLLGGTGPAAAKRGFTGVSKAAGALESVLGANMYGEGVTQAHDAASKGDLPGAAQAALGAIMGIVPTAHGAMPKTAFLRNGELGPVEPVSYLDGKANLARDLTFGDTAESLKADKAPGVRIGANDPFAGKERSGKREGTGKDVTGDQDVDRAAKKAARNIRGFRDSNNKLQDRLLEFYETIPRLSKYTRNAPVFTDPVDAVAYIYSKAAEAKDLKTAKTITDFFDEHGIEPEQFENHAVTVNERAKAGDQAEPVSWQGKTPEELAALMADGRKGPRSVTTNPRAVEAGATEGPLTARAQEIVDEVKREGIYEPGKYTKEDLPHIAQAKKFLGIAPESPLLYDSSVPLELGEVSPSYTGPKFGKFISHELNVGKTRVKLGHERSFDKHVYEAGERLRVGDLPGANKLVQEIASDSGIPPAKIWRHAVEMRNKFEQGDVAGAISGNKKLIIGKDGNVTFGEKGKQGIKPGYKKVNGKYEPRVEATVVPDENTVTPDEPILDAEIVPDEVVPSEPVIPIEPVKLAEEVIPTEPIVPEEPIKPAEELPVEPLEVVKPTEQIPSVTPENEVAPIEPIQSNENKGIVNPENTEIIPETPEQVKPPEDPLNVEISPLDELVPNEPVRPEAKIENAVPNSETPQVPLPSIEAAVNNVVNEPVPPVDTSPVIPPSTPSIQAQGRKPRNPRTSPPPNQPPVPPIGNAPPPNNATPPVPPIPPTTPPPGNVPPVTPNPSPSLASRIYETPRDLQTIGEASFMGRQGINHLWSHPINWAKELGRSTGALFSDSYANSRKAELKSNPLYQEALDNNVALEDTGSNQFHGGSLVPKFITEPFKRAHDVGSSGVRMFEYGDLRGKLEKAKAKEGLSLTDLDKQSLGKAVNDSTGRGELKVGTGKYEGANLERFQGPLGKIGYSPRFFSARMAQLNPLNMTKGHTKYQLDPNYQGSNVLSNDLIKKNMLKFGGTTALGAILKGIGQIDDIGLDPRETDFMQLKKGDTRFDLTGGSAGKLRDLTRIVAGQGKDNEDSIVDEFTTGHPLNALGIGFGRTAKGLIDTARYSVHPTLDAAITGATGKNAVGLPARRPFTNTGITLPITGTSLDNNTDIDTRGLPETLSHLSPLFGQQTFEASRDNELGDVGKITTLLGGYAGAGVKTYNKEERKEIEKITKATDKKKEEDDSKKKKSAYEVIKAPKLN